MILNSFAALHVQQISSTPVSLSSAAGFCSQNNMFKQWGCACWEMGDSQELLEFINDKDDLLKMAKRTNNEEDWNTASIVRDLVAGMVRNAKKDFLQEEINQNHYKFWKAISKLLPKFKSNTPIYFKIMPIIIVKLKMKTSQTL